MTQKCEIIPILSTILTNLQWNIVVSCYENQGIRKIAYRWMQHDQLLTLMYIRLFSESEFASWNRLRSCHDDWTGKIARDSLE